MTTVGRPTKYQESFCSEVIVAGEAGLSLTAFAGVIGVCRDTISEWVKVHPEFSAATKIHQAKRTAYLERTLLSSDSGPMVTARIFALKNTAPHEWRDKMEVAHGVTSDLAAIIAERRARIAEIGDGDEA